METQSKTTLGPEYSLAVPRNPYAFWSNPLQFASILISGPNDSADPDYLAAVTASRTFDANKSLPPTVADLLLRHAESRFAEAVAGYNSLVARNDEMFRTIGVLVTVYVALSSAAGLQFNWLSALAITFYLLSSVVLLLARKPGSHPVRASIHSIRTNLPAAADPHDWLAGSLHQVVAGITIRGHIRSAQLNVAIWLMVCGLGTMAVSLAVALSRKT